MRLTVQTIQTILAAIVLLLAAARVETQTPRKKGDSTIRGTVVYSDTGRPLRHARISLFAANGQWQTDGVSDLRGRFVLANLAAGKYFLAVEAPGLLRTQDDVLVPRRFVSEQWFLSKSELLTEVTVNGTDSIDLKVQAIRGGVITGRVVTDDDEPLVNADIRLLRRENGKWMPDWTTWSASGEDTPGRKTDASGVYRIAGLPSGDYLVRVSEPTLGDDRIPGDADAYRDGSFMFTYYPVATRAKDAQTVTVVAGSEATGIDIRAPERAPHTLAGTVTVGPENTAAAFVEVRVEPKDEPGFEAIRKEVAARTDPEGRWRVDGLPAGEYFVTFSGSVSDSTRELLVWTEVPPKRVAVRIHNKKITALNTRLLGGARVAGKVMFNGQLSDQRWRIFPGVTGEPVESRGRSGLLDNSGIFEIAGLEPGDYWFTLTLLQSSDYYVKSVTRKGVDLMQTSFKLTEGAVFDEITVTLASDLANVEGQITLPEGAPKRSLSDVVVIIAPANELTRRFGHGTRGVAPDAQGKIVFRAAPGEYFITALTAAQYKQLEPQINYEYFDKNAEKFLRVKLRAGEKLKGLALPIADK